MYSLILPRIYESKRDSGEAAPSGYFLHVNLFTIAVGQCTKISSGICLNRSNGM